jgi:hypothetical protein
MQIICLGNTSDLEEIVRKKNMYVRCSYLLIDTYRSTYNLYNVKKLKLSWFNNFFFI